MMRALVREWRPNGFASNAVFAVRALQLLKSKLEALERRGEEGWSEMLRLEVGSLSCRSSVLRFPSCSAVSLITLLLCGS